MYDESQMKINYIVIRNSVQFCRRNGTRNTIIRQKTQMHLTFILFYGQSMPKPKTVADTNRINALLLKIII